MAQIFRGRKRFWLRGRIRTYALPRHKAFFYAFLLNSWRPRREDSNLRTEHSTSRSSTQLLNLWCPEEDSNLTSGSPREASDAGLNPLTIRRRC
jgi:hypothetical protein